MTYGEESYRSQFSFEKRKEDSDKILRNYPDRIPIICERARGSDIPAIDKKKYLVPADLTVGQFVYVIRKRLTMKKEQAIFVFVKDRILPPIAQPLSKLYQEHKDKDGFVYITYSGENTFGTDC